MLHLLVGQFPNNEAANSAIVRDLSSRLFPGIEAIDVLEAFSVDDTTTEASSTFHSYYAASLTVIGQPTRHRLALVVSARRWKGLLTYVMADETQCPPHFDAPSVLLSRLDPPMTPKSAHWRKMCLSAPWEFELDIQSTREGWYALNLRGHRKGKHVRFLGYTIPESLIETALQGMREDYPDIVIRFDFGPSRRCMGVKGSRSPVSL